MSTAERLIIWALSRQVKNGNAIAARHIFDDKYSDRPEEWRRDIWRQAAERAERKVRL